MEPRFKIGDCAWRATFDSNELWVTCPDCGGDGRLRVLLHDDTMVSVECEGCKLGFNPPSGRVRVYERKPRAEPCTITGYEVRPEGVEWRVDSRGRSYHVSDEDIFAVEESALSHALSLALRHDREERERIQRKEKPTHSWAWNASYHRREIKEAQRRIEWHTAKLNVASLKAKEDKAAKVAP